MSIQRMGGGDGSKRGLLLGLVTAAALCVVIAGPGYGGEPQRRSRPGKDRWSARRQAAEVTKWEVFWKGTKELLGMEEPRRADMGMEMYLLLLDDVRQRRDKITEKNLWEGLVGLEEDLEAHRRDNKDKILTRYMAKGKEILAALEGTVAEDPSAEGLQAMADRLASLAGEMHAMNEDFADQANELIKEAKDLIAQADLEAKVPLALLWSSPRQRAFVVELEGLWHEARRLIDMANRQEVDIGLGKYEELVDRIEGSGQRITRPEMRERIEKVREGMQQKKQIIKLKILERYVKQGKQTLAAMNLAFGAEDYKEVVKLYDEDLAPLCDRMIDTDEDFTEVAMNIRGKGAAIKAEVKSTD